MTMTTSLRHQCVKILTLLLVMAAMTSAFSSSRTYSRLDTALGALLLCVCIIVENEITTRPFSLAVFLVQPRSRLAVQRQKKHRPLPCHLVMPNTVKGEDRP